MGAMLLSLTAAGQQSAGPSRLDYTAFQIITERNIFNPNRGRRGTPMPTEETQQPSRLDAFTLVGTMIYRKGPFAFFDGTRSDYRKVLQPGGRIADCTVAEIGLGQVKLQAASNLFELKVGMQLRRANDGPWQVAEATDSYASLRSSGSERRWDDRGSDSRSFNSRRGEWRGFNSRRGEPRGLTSAEPARPSPTPSTASSGPALTPEQENEILQRLMRKREEESR